MAVHRVTARVLPVSPDGAVLLLQEVDPAEPGVPYWSSIGGGVDQGETVREAAARELLEEVGIDIEPERLTDPILRHQSAYSWNGVDYAGDHTYFALRIERDVVVSFDRLETDEVDTVLGAGWWSPADLVDGAAFRPRDLPEIMRVALEALSASGRRGGDL